MRGGPEPTLKFRGTLAVFAAAFIATAGMLAFSGDEAPVDSAAPARDQQVADDRNEAIGVVRARGRGLATPSLPTVAPQPTVRLLAIREEAEREVRERIGEEETESPEGEDAVEEIVGLVEDGSSVEDAVDEVLGDREDAPSPPPLPLPGP